LVPLRRPLKAFNSALAPVVLVSVLTMVTVVIVIGVEIEIFDVVGMRSSSFNQTAIVAAIGMVDVINITKIAIERRERPASAGRFFGVYMSSKCRCYLDHESVGAREPIAARFHFQPRGCRTLAHGAILDAVNFLGLIH
jgi:hypothetical protein